MRRGSTTGLLLAAAALCLCAFALGRAWPSAAVGAAAAEGQVFEIRMYTVEDGKVEALSRVFHDNVTQMFARHGMSNVAYFIPREDPQCGTAGAGFTIQAPVFDYGPCEWSRDTLIYILGHASREAADANWASFAQDAAGMRSFREDYARAGVKVMKIESVYMDATEYSALR